MKAALQFLSRVIAQANSALNTATTPLIAEAETALSVLSLTEAYGTAAWLATSPSSDDDVAQTIVVLTSLLHERPDSALGMSLMRIITRTSFELRRCRRFRVLLQIAKHVSEAALKVVCEAGLDSSHYDTAATMLSQELLGYQHNASLFIDVASHLRRALEGLRKASSLDANDLTLKSAALSVASTSHASLFLHRNFFSCRGGCVSATPDDDDPVNLLSVSVRNFFGGREKVPPATAVLQLLSAHSWSPTPLTIEMSVKSTNEDDSKTQRTTVQTSQALETKTKDTHDDATFSCLPPWIEGDFETETQKKISISSIESVAGIPLRFLPREDSHGSSQSESRRTELHRLSGLAYKPMDVICSPNESASFKFSGHLWWSKKFGAERNAKTASSSSGTALQWTCDKCTMMNPGTRKTCSACNSKAPAKTTAVSDGQIPCAIEGLFHKSVSKNARNQVPGAQGWCVDRENKSIGWMGRKVELQDTWSPIDDIGNGAKSGGFVLSLPGPLGPGAYLNLGSAFSFGYDGPFTIELLVGFPEARLLPRDGCAQTILANGEYGIGITAEGKLCAWRHGTAGKVQLSGDNGRSLIVAEKTISISTNGSYFRHIALRYSGREAGNVLDLLMDGEIIASSNSCSASTHRDVSTPLLVGAFPKFFNAKRPEERQVGEFFEGSICELRIWSRSLETAGSTSFDQAVMWQLADSVTGLKGYWPFVGPGDGSAYYLKESSKGHCHARVQCEYDRANSPHGPCHPQISGRSLAKYHSNLPRSIAHMKRRSKSTIIAGDVLSSVLPPSSEGDTSKLLSATLGGDGPESIPGALWCANKLPMQDGFELVMGFGNVSSNASKEDKIATHARITLQTGSWWNLNTLPSEHVSAALEKGKKDVSDNLIVESDGNSKSLPKAPEVAQPALPLPTQEILPTGVLEEDVSSFMAFTGDDRRTAIIFLDEVKSYNGPEGKLERAIALFFDETQKQRLLSSATEKAASTSFDTRSEQVATNTAADHIDAATLAAIQAVSDWTCSACTMANMPSATKCGTCGTERPKVDLNADAVVESQSKNTSVSPSLESGSKIETQKDTNPHTTKLISPTVTIDIFRHPTTLFSVESKLQFWTIVIRNGLDKKISGLIAAVHSVQASGNKLWISYDESLGQLIIKQGSSERAKSVEDHGNVSDKPSEDTGEVLMVCRLNLARVLKSSDRHTWIGISSTPFPPSGITADFYGPLAETKNSNATVNQHSVRWSWLPASIFDFHVRAGLNKVNNSPEIVDNCYLMDYGEDLDIKWNSGSKQKRQKGKMKKSEENSELGTQESSEKFDQSIADQSTLWEKKVMEFMGITGVSDLDLSRRWLAREDGKLDTAVTKYFNDPKNEPKLLSDYPDYAPGGFAVCSVKSWVPPMPITSNTRFPKQFVDEFSAYNSAVSEKIDEEFLKPNLFKNCNGMSMAEFKAKYAQQLNEIKNTLESFDQNQCTAILILLGGSVNFSARDCVQRYLTHGLPATMPQKLTSMAEYWALKNDGKFRIPTVSKFIANGTGSSSATKDTSSEGGQSVEQTKQEMAATHDKKSGKSSEAGANEKSSEARVSLLQKVMSYRSALASAHFSGEKELVIGEWDFTFGASTSARGPILCGERVYVRSEYKRKLDEKSGNYEKVGGRICTGIARLNINGHWTVRGSYTDQSENIPRTCFIDFDADANYLESKWYKKSTLTENKRVQRITDSSMFRYKDPSRGGAVGLLNGRDGLVNVCFQNSVLQSLFHARDLREDILALNIVRKDSPEISVFANLQAALGKLGSGVSSNFATHELQKTLPSYDFGSGRQQDANEFLGYLTKIIDTIGVLTSNNSGQEGKSTAVSSSLVRKHFGATISTVNTCLKCGTLKPGQREQSNEFSLPFPTRFEPLTDIRVVSGKTADVPAPPGFERISFNLNQGRTGNGVPYVFVCVRRGDRTEKPITSVTLFTRNHDEVPLNVVASSMEDGKWSGWNIVAGSLNEGGKSTSEEVFLGFKREDDGSPIVNLSFLCSDETPKEDGFKRVNMDLNRGDSKETIYMCYQQNMPIVDIALAENGKKGFRFVDQNLRLSKLDTSLYLMHTDSSGSNLESEGKMPITNLMLVETSSIDSSYQRIAPGVNFDGTKELVVTRGNGCPITGLSVFRSPHLRPRHGYPEYIDLVKPAFEGSVHRFSGIWKAAPLENKSKSVGTNDSKGKFALDAAAAAGIDAASLAKIQSMAGEIQSVSTTAPNSKGLMDKDRSEIHFIMTDQELAPLTIVSGTFRPGPGEKGSARKISGYAYRNRGTSSMSLIGCIYPSGADLKDTANDEEFDKAGAFCGFQIDFTIDGIILRGFLPVSQNNGASESKLHDNNHDATWFNSLNIEQQSNTIVSPSFITDVSLVKEGEPVPEGFERIRTTLNDVSADLNIGCSAKSLYLCVRRGSDKPPIVDVSIVFELELGLGFEGSGWEVIKSTALTGSSANLNYGVANSPPMYICIKRKEMSSSSPLKTALLDLGVVKVGGVSSSACPPSFSRINKSCGMAAEEANINQGNLNVGHKMFLCKRIGEAPAQPLPHHRMNGHYSASTQAMHNFNAFTGGTSVTVPSFVLELYAVGAKWGHQVEGRFGLNKDLGGHIRGVLVGNCNAKLPKEDFLSPGEDASLSNDYTLSSNDPDSCNANVPSCSGPWHMLGLWRKGNSAYIRHHHCSFHFPLSGRLGVGNGRWSYKSERAVDSSTGAWKIVRDDFVQVAFKKDYSTSYSGGMRIFGSRATRHDMNALVNEFFASNVLGGDNKVECEKCLQRTEHVQHKFLVKSPEILVTTVKRFSYDWRRNKATKSLMDVHFKPCIVLPSLPIAKNGEKSLDIEERRELMKPRCYGLFAVVVHSGATINSGHYYCYARSTDAKDQLDLKDAPASPWMKLNDSRITIVEGGFNKMRSDIRESVSSTAYMLLYRRLNKGPEMIRQQSTFKKVSEVVGGAKESVDQSSTLVSMKAKSQSGIMKGLDIDDKEDECDNGDETYSDDEEMLAAALALSAEKTSTDSEIQNAHQKQGDEIEENSTSNDEDDEDLAAALAMSSSGNTCQKKDSEASNQGNQVLTQLNFTSSTSVTISTDSLISNVKDIDDDLESYEGLERQNAQHVLDFCSHMKTYAQDNLSYLSDRMTENTSSQWARLLRDSARIQFQNLSSTQLNTSTNDNLACEEVSLWEWPQIKNTTRHVRLRALGFCGADDSVDPEELLEISRTFPSVEWGVLFRPDKEGTPRYASSDWVFNRLAIVQRIALREGIEFHLAAHLCGSRVVDVLNGDASFVKKLRDEVGFKRFQVNATAANGVDTSRLPDFVSGLRASMNAVHDVEWIVQRNEETRPLWEGLIGETSDSGTCEKPPENMSVLFDASMGLGVAIREFPEPPSPNEVPKGCGYAGGIGPQNVREVLTAVTGAARGMPTWIDMESSLRTMHPHSSLNGDKVDIFDLDKCRSCIAKAQSLVV